VEECPVNRCNQTEGHTGPHGAEISPGFIVGPFGHTGKGSRCDELTVVICDACNKSPLKVTWRNDGPGGILTCTDQSCGQEHAISEDASGTCISKTLYPSRWERGCKQWPHYIGERIKSAEHYSQMCVVLDVDYDLNSFLEVAAKEFAEHNKLVREMPWWKKLWELVK